MQYRYLRGKYKDIDELKREYKRLAKALHPDAGGTNEEFQQLLREFEGRAKELNYTHDSISKFIIESEPEIKVLLTRLIDVIKIPEGIIPKFYTEIIKTKAKDTLLGADFDKILRQLNKKS
jgi:hypothetical protein